MQTRGSEERRTGLRVGFLLDRWDPARGGAEAAMAALAGHLERRGHAVLAFAREGVAGAPGALVEVRAAGWTRAARERELARGLADAARARACDVTVGMRHLERVDLYWPHDGAHAATLAARRDAAGRAPSPPTRGRHALFLELERALLERGGARRVACVSRLVRAELAELYPACVERLVLVENGVDLARFHPGRRAVEGLALREQLGVAASVPLLVFAGADARRKGLRELLEALARLAHAPWSLLVAGARRPAAWKRLARARGLDEARVRFVEPQAPERLWAAADLCVLPTWRDACGLVVLEALASGVPVVTTRRAGASDAIESPTVGTVLPAPGEVDALKLALEDWIGFLERGPPDREAIRAAVSGRGLEAWLERLEGLVLELARDGQR